MRWRATAVEMPGRSLWCRRYVSEDGVYKVEPRYALRGTRVLRRVVFHLYENHLMIGRPFHSARLAKAFAEALAALGDDRRARAELIRDGAGWCWDKEREWRHEREQREVAS